MEKDVIEKIRICKALQGKTIVDVCSMPQFMDNVSAYLAEQKELREVTLRAIPNGKRAASHVIDRIKLDDVTGIIDEYVLILAKKSRKSASERLYIEQICQQAYNLTICQIVCKEFPELNDKLMGGNES